ncbi:MAG: hypothetical protein RBR71_13375 [Gudongella sp.]|nr:hypothetical protein [Gudongella sp.]
MISENSSRIYRRIAKILNSEIRAGATPEEIFEAITELSAELFAATHDPAKNSEEWADMFVEKTKALVKEE